METVQYFVEYYNSDFTGFAGRFDIPWKTEGFSYLKDAVNEAEILKSMKMTNVKIIKIVTIRTEIE